jgi:hypothetical protein
MHNDNTPRLRTGWAAIGGPPMHKAQNYRIQGLLAANMAASSRNPDHKALILRISELWLELAAQAEGSGGRPAPSDAPLTRSAAGG